MANFNINKVILGGRLTADPELKQTPSGVSVCQISLAVNRRFSKEGEEKQADFINCVAWRNTAEFISRYFRKGSSLCVVGQIQIRSWTDSNGQKRYATEVLVDEALFVDSKNDAQNAETTGADSYTPYGFNAPITPNFTEQNADDDFPF